MGAYPFLRYIPTLVFISKNARIYLAIYSKRCNFVSHKKTRSYFHQHIMAKRKKQNSYGKKAIYIVISLIALFVIGFEAYNSR